MDGSKKPKIIVIVICLVLAIGVTYWTRRGGKSGVVKGSVYMLCVNSECGKTFEMTIERYREKVQTERSEMVTASAESITFKCEFCGQETVSMAEKCPRCSTFFIRDDDNADDWPDRCPECGYSRSEEIRKNK